MKKFYFYWLVFLHTYFLFANGSPFNENYLYQTGNIVPIKKEKIQLLNEQLYIKIVNHDFCEVTVEYTFKNQGQNDSVNICFPVNFLAYENEEAINDYSISIEKQSINFTLRKVQGENLFSFPKNNFLDGFNDIDHSSIQHQYRFLSKLFFPAQKTQKVIIKYTVQNASEDWESSKSIIPTYSLRKFRYDLSPAHFWGNGKTNSIKITVDATSLEDSISIKNWDGFKHKNHIYTFFQKDFQYHENQVLAFEYLPNKAEKLYFSLQLDKNQLLNTTSFPKLFDKKFSTQWKGKVNDTIILKLDSSQIYNRIQVSLLQSNIKKVKIEFDYISMTSSYPEWGNYVDEINCPQHNYQFKHKHLSIKNFVHLTDNVHSPFRIKIQHIKITVVETYDDKSAEIAELFILHD